MKSGDIPNSKRITLKNEIHCPCPKSFLGTLAQPARDAPQNLRKT